MASSDEGASSDGEVKNIKSYIQVPDRSLETSRTREKRSRRSRSHTPRENEEYPRKQSLERDQNPSSDDEYYRRERKVQKLAKERFAEEPYDDERDKENIRDQRAFEKKEYSEFERKRKERQRHMREKDQTDNGSESEDSDHSLKRTDRNPQREADRNKYGYDARERYERRTRDRGEERSRNRDRNRHAEERESSEEEDKRYRDRDVDRSRREKERERRHRDKESYREDREERGARKEKDDDSRNKLSGQEEGEKSPKDKQKETTEKKRDIMDILTRTGGAYIPPARLRQMQESITDKSSAAYQRMAWEALKKSINGLVNKVNVANIANIVQELFEENIVRGRGLFCQSVMRAQVASPIFTNVYAALIAIVNTKFPKIGELILRRLILQFRRAYRRNDKTVCINSAKFIAHLVNQQVAHELLSLEVLTLLLQNPTDDSVEVAVAFLKEVGQKLSEVSPRGLNAVFERLRSILNESSVDKRVQYMIEVMFAIRKDGFKDHQAVLAELDLVEEDDQITHLLRLDDDGATEDILNVFKADPDYEENEEKYKMIKKEIIGGDSDDEEDEDGDSDDDEDDDDEEGNEAGDDEKMEIIDKTETNLVALRRTIYLTIQSSLDYEECAHKMMKMNLKPGQEHEFCLMIIDCCAQQRTYEKFFGLLAQRFCLMKKEFMEQYVILFKEQYEIIHRYDTNKLRNVAKFFAHLLYSDAIPWTVIECIHLNEEDTTSSSRIFIKILFQCITEYLGIPKLNSRIRDPYVDKHRRQILIG